MDNGSNTYYRSAYSVPYGEGYVPYRHGLDPEVDEISCLGDAVSSASPEQNKHILSFKRAFDVIFSIVALVLLSPVLLAAAILIKIESPGPVFFTQERIGINRRRRDRRRTCGSNCTEMRTGEDRRKSINAGRPFNIFKLRTMRMDAEKSGPKLACVDDPRITRIGRIMRKTRIDEIPQFINVIKGDMSIIGPRPERSFFINMVKQDIPEFPLRLLVKPGITGLAQVENGYTQSVDQMKDKLFYDLQYIKELSIFKEIKIIFKTLSVIATGKGAC
jgi:lipopolysaccharide/colanic/teichoic acid biosynthesis glycosyltransferase